MTHHELKSHPQYYQKIIDGVKLFEIRKNDRNFRILDTVTLNEWDPVSQDYTGRHESFIISYIAEPSEISGLRDGYICFSLRPFYKPEVA